MPGTISWAIQLSKIKLSPVTVHFLLSQQREIQDIHCQFRLSKKTCPKPVKLSFHICSHCRNQRPNFPRLNFLARQMGPLGWCLWSISELELQTEKYAFVKLLETRSSRRLVYGVWNKRSKTWCLLTRPLYRVSQCDAVVKQKEDRKETERLRKWQFMWSFIHLEKWQGHSLLPEFLSRWWSQSGVPGARVG